MANLYRCPMCEAQVIAQDLAGFRCPTCGFAGGNQLSLFRIGTDNSGSIEYIGPFDPQKNAANAYSYHNMNPEESHR